MGKIMAFEKPKKRTKFQGIKIPDVITRQRTEVEEVLEDGTKVIKPKYITINLSKKVNETAKTLKMQNTAAMEARLDEIFEEKKAEMAKEVAKAKKNLQ